MSENKKINLNEGYLEAQQKLVVSQNQILELAVKVIVNPTYGWLTAALILYGCRPIEAFSLIPSADGTASVIDFNEKPSNNIRRTIKANPFDFVEKLNMVDQVSQPIFFHDFEDYDFNEINNIIMNWDSWFKDIQNNLELDEIRNYWAKRVISDGISKEIAATYMGISLKEFCLKYF